MPVIASKIDVLKALRRARELVDLGLWDDAIRLLTGANQQEENAKIETRLVRLRHLAYHEIDMPDGALPWPKPILNHFSEISTIPEIPA